MARLTREQMFSIAAANGWVRGQPLTAPQRLAIRTAFMQQLQSADALNAAPTIFDVDGGRTMTVRDALSAIVEELT